MRRHLDRDAGRLHVSEPLGEWGKPRRQRHRLGRILPDASEGRAAAYTIDLTR